MDNEALDRDNEALNLDNGTLDRVNVTLSMDNEALDRDNETLNLDNGTLDRVNVALSMDNEALDRDNETLNRDNETLHRLGASTLPRLQPSSCRGLRPPTDPQSPYPIVILRGALATQRIWAGEWPCVLRSPAPFDQRRPREVRPCCERIGRCALGQISVGWGLVSCMPGLTAIWLLAHTDRRDGYGDR